MRTFGPYLTCKWIFVFNFLSVAELYAWHHIDVLWCFIFGVIFNTDLVVNRLLSAVEGSTNVLTPLPIVAPVLSVQVICKHENAVK